MTSGTLYGIGLGPGDPDLITLKAARLIAAVPVVAYPTLEAGDSFARSIAAGFVPAGAQELPIPIPMTTDRAPAQAAYDAGAAAIAAHLDAGRDVAVLCEGDPFFYGSFMYLFSRLSGDHRVEVVPGVTSVTACAAVVGQPLSARNEVLTILPCSLHEPELKARIEAASSVAIIKVGRHLNKIRRVLGDLSLIGHAVYVERATLPNECYAPLAEAPEKAPYFSMILVSRGKDPWL
ncbi:MAG: precorrin-2 C(20)-methyltransferase [Rhodobacteraceae bacterium]|nr:precorrin-2 C(20)-methyltransferase [Paracoccaceae bacterium]